MDSSRKVLHNAHPAQTTTPPSGEEPPSESGKPAAPRVRTRSRAETPSLCIQRPLTQEVLYKTQTAYGAMIKTEQHLITVHHYVKPMIDADAKLSKDLKTYKKGTRINAEEVRDSDNYQKAVASLEQLEHKKNRSLLDVADFLDKKSVFHAKIYPLTGGIRDTGTGFYAQLVPDVFNPSTYFLCFPGTGAMNNLDKQWTTNIDNVMSDKVPASFTQALQLTAEILQAVSAVQGHLTLVGHSLGGGIANYVGLKLGMESVCFNPAGMGKACLADLANAITPERVNQQTHLVIEDDLVSDGRAMKWLQQVRGHTLPMVGKVYLIPREHPEYPAEMSAADRHRMDGFHDLYMIARKEKAQLHVAMRNSAKTPTATNPVKAQAPGTTTTTTTTVTTTAITNTTGAPFSPPSLRAPHPYPHVAEDDASEETVKERRRQAAREEKKPETQTNLRPSVKTSDPSATRSDSGSRTSSHEDSSESD